MTKLPDGAKTKELLEELRNRFLDGEKLTVHEIVQEYSDPKNPFLYLQMVTRVRSWMTHLKHQFRSKEGLWFGNVDDNGKYGFITTTEEAQYAMMRYYRYVKGNIQNAALLATNASNQGLLPANVQKERLLVNRIVTEEKDEKKHRTGAVAHRFH